MNTGRGSSGRRVSDLNNCNLLSTSRWTYGVTLSPDAHEMGPNRITLEPGSLVRCPHCRHWHPVFIGHDSGTPYTQAMLYFVCRNGRYYAGQIGHTSRHPTRSFRRGLLDTQRDRSNSMPSFTGHNRRAEGDQLDNTLSSFCV